MLEDEDVTEYYEGEVDEDGERVENGDDADNVVVSGDPSAAANALKNGEKSIKDKKIPENERSTTPYMTKYERARILGTRALQIRYADLLWKRGFILLDFFLFLLLFFRPFFLWYDNF